FSIGGPSQLVALLAAGEPGYVPPGLPSTSTAPADTMATAGLAGSCLVAGLTLVALGARRSRRL
ncbi:MAG TPA: hypothetical protein VIN37_05165, partial [Candidatus Limnocylindria bacterium]